MAGLDLKTMDVSDMLDVFHFLMEEENTYTSEENMQSRLKMKEVIYEKLYGTTFKYKYKGDNKKSATQSSYTPSASQDFDDIPEADEARDGPISPFEPREQPTKPQIQFTEYDPDAEKPFGNILDAPLG
jgi:hypothetical protein